MAKQPEQILEEQLVAQLQKLSYGLMLINNEKDLIANLKTQLEKHNNIQFSKAEFEKVLNILSKGSVFEKAKTLRAKQHIVRDDGDNLYFEFIQTEHWCTCQCTLRRPRTNHRISRPLYAQGSHHRPPDIAHR